jgi:two-component system, OmpR family, sensor histidine kinase KdpD
MPENRANSFLQMIRRSQRGRLKVYFGYGPGVGKTYQMLSEGHRLKQDGIDVVVGLVETHGRAETAKLIEGLEVTPRRRVEYHGIAVDEMDVDAILARRPAVVLIDELAHTNVPGSRNGKRYEDVQEILASGIHVITTLNVQHLESLYNTVEQLIGVRVRERLPDAVLADADEVVNIDLAAEDLQKRLREGKVYPKERVATSLENFFTTSNLEHLRELTVREIASQLDFRRRESAPDDKPASASPDQVMVCLSSRGPNSARLLRFASRLAGRLNRNWYAVYVQTPSEEPTRIDATTQRLLGDTLTLANQLGATVFTFKGQDVADTILRFANEYRVGTIVIGRPRRVRWWQRLLGQRSVAEQLVQRAAGLTVVVVDAESEEAMSIPMAAPARLSLPFNNSPISTAPPPKLSSAGERPQSAEPARSSTPVTQSMTLGDILSESRILVWEVPMSKSDVIRQLAESIDGALAPMSPEQAIERIQDRESQGSTFLNEGVALPHARLKGLTAPQVALGVTHAGVLDAPTARPIEVVFMLLTPEDNAAAHLRLLAAAGRALQERSLRQSLTQAGSPSEVLHALREVGGTVARQ